MRTLSTSLITLSLVLWSAAQAEDCAVGKQYLARAQEQVSNSHRSAAVPLLQQSIAACPSYDAYEMLAEALGRSRNRRDWVGAADAFVNAHALAPNPKARAQTLYQYASLVNDDGDPQNAYPMIKKAYALDPSRPEIAQLAAKIEKQIQAPKKSQIMRSFGLSVYKPLMSATSGGGGGGSSVTVSRVSSSADAVSGAGHRQVNIPINFKFDSVDANEKTQANLALLAHTLADPSFVQKQFVFIGHSDSRGDPQYNLVLSKRRADAMRSNVLHLEPSLAGRIDVDGRGSSDPIDAGTDLQAMSANRRLQVLVKE